MDEPNDRAGIPESEAIDAVSAHIPDRLDGASRAALHQALFESEQDVQAGRFTDAAAVLKELRRRNLRRPMKDYAAVNAYSV